jgi:biotin operon repressor
MTVHQRVLAVQACALEPGARFVVMTLALALDAARPEDGTTLPLDDLCERTGMSRSTINAHLAELVRLGVVTRTRTRMYTVTRIDFEALAAVSAKETRRGGDRRPVRSSDGGCPDTGHETSGHRTSEHRTSDVRTSDTERPNIGHETSGHRTSDVRTSDPIRLGSVSAPSDPSPPPNPSPTGEGLGDGNEAALGHLRSALDAYLGRFPVTEDLHRRFAAGDRATLERVRAWLKASGGWPLGTRLRDLSGLLADAMRHIAPVSAPSDTPLAADEEEDLPDAADVELGSELARAVEIASVAIGAAVDAERRAVEAPRRGADAIPAAARVMLEAARARLAGQSQPPGVHAARSCATEVGR